MSIKITHAHLYIYNEQVIWPQLLWMYLTNNLWWTYIHGCSLVWCSQLPTVPLKANFENTHELWLSNKSSVKLCRVNLCLHNNNSKDPLCIALPYMIQQVKIIFSSGFLHFKFLFYCPCWIHKIDKIVT